MMLKDLLRDERGTVSAARTFLLGVLLFTGTIIVLDSIILAVQKLRTHSWVALTWGCLRGQAVQG